MHPTSYKVFDWKNNHPVKKKLPKNKIVEDFMIVDTAQTLDCFDLARTSNTFQIKVFGIKICFQNNDLKKTLIISAIVDDLVMQCCNETYVKKFIEDFKEVLSMYGMT